MGASYRALPQVDLHLGQPRGVPRHPERQAAEEGRHRQRATSPSSRTAGTATPAACSWSATPPSRPSGCAPSPTTPCGTASSRSSPASRLGDIGFAIQRFAESNGFSVVREFCGHGIGRGFHEEPQVLHYGKPGTLDELKPGMTFTIEPMINAGKRDIKEVRQRRLDHRHARPFAVGAVGAHGAGHRDRLRGADAVGRQPAAARLRRHAAA